MILEIIRVIGSLRKTYLLGLSRDSHINTSSKDLGNQMNTQYSFFLLTGFFN